MSTEPCKHILGTCCAGDYDEIDLVQDSEEAHLYTRGFEPFAFCPKCASPLKEKTDALAAMIAIEEAKREEEQKIRNAEWYAKEEEKKRNPPPPPTGEDYFQTEAARLSSQGFWIPEGTRILKYFPTPNEP